MSAAVIPSVLVLDARHALDRLLEPTLSTELRKVLADTEPALKKASCTLLRTNTPWTAQSHLAGFQCSWDSTASKGAGLQKPKLCCETWPSKMQVAAACMSPDP